MKITVSTQILSGNLGDGWADNNEAAQGFADFLRPKLEAEIADRYPGAEIEIDIDVQRKTSGCSRDLSVTVDGAEDAKFEIMDKVEEVLPYTVDAAWEDFCGGAGEKYFTEES